MKRDISALLREWPHQPGQVNARLIAASDGEEDLVQVRLDLGILQMSADDRPDGERPHGFLSLLEYFEAKLDGELDDSREAREPRKGRDPAEAGEQAAKEPLSLTAEDCRALREEAAQYYQRYVACLALEDFDRVVRDTTRNLRVLDLCARHATQEHDRVVLEQFRAYIIMVRARAQASQAIRDDELKAAVFAIDHALDQLKRAFADQHREREYDQSEEVKILRSMRDALAPRLPVSQREELKLRLQQALETENYELAAILRDELKQLKDGLA